MQRTIALETCGQRFTLSDDYLVSPSLVQAGGGVGSASARVKDRGHMGHFRKCLHTICTHAFRGWAIAHTPVTCHQLVGWQNLWGEEMVTRTCRETVSVSVIRRFHSDHGGPSGNASGPQLKGRGHQPGFVLHVSPGLTPPVPDIF